MRTTARAARIPRWASATVVKPITGQSFSCVNTSSEITSVNGATSSRVLAVTRIPARSAIHAADRPTTSVFNAPSGNMYSRSRCVASASRMCAPLRVSAELSFAAMASSAISTDSLVHSTELSKALLSTMRRAAASMSALASTKTGTLPGPTPRAGLPDE